MCLREVVNKCYATCMTLGTEMCTARGVVVVGSNFGA